MGLLSSIFADDNDGPINKETLYTLCVLVLDIVRETEDLKSSKYIKALISFLVFPTHVKEKQYNPIKYSGFILKPASDRADPGVDRGNGGEDGEGGDVY